MSEPPLTAQLMVDVLVPVSVQVLLPVLTNTPKPWYCALAPISETSKLALPLPPRRSVSAVLKATTLPVIAEPGCSNQVQLFERPVVDHPEQAIYFHSGGKRPQRTLVSENALTLLQGCLES
jgi:hypothetical protein